VATIEESKQEDAVKMGADNIILTPPMKEEAGIELAVVDYL